MGKKQELQRRFDTRLFERLSFSFDYYNRLTTDLLQDVPTSMTVGFTSALKKRRLHD